MKTKTRKTTRILCASTLAAMTILGSAAPALTTVMAEGDGTTAATSNVNLGVKDNVITFDKKIYLDTNENVPNATINYTLASREATAGEKTDLENAGYHNIKAGTKTLSSSSTTFSAEDSADEGQNYVSKTATIDASDLLDGLNQPTVYTYTLTESVQGDSADFISTDKGTTRKLNIYVGYKDKAAEESNSLSVLYSTLALENGTKATGFENKYDTSENEDTKAFKITKKVTGNQGDKTTKFNFTVTITGQHSKVTTETTGDSAVKATTPTAENSTVTVKTQLKDGETLTLKGLTKGATYTVDEDDKNSNGYTTNIGTPTKNDDKSVEETVVTNNREGTIPTGIYLNHKLPFNILGVALAGGAVALIAKKRHDDLEDDE